MNRKEFVVYACLVALWCTVMCWTSMGSSDQHGSGSGSSWSSSSSGGGGSGWGGGHK
ncbi:MAG: hypothetical protein ACRYGK_16525 [Janthinobacterium lividum]